MSDKQYVLSAEELNSLHKDASVSEAIKELASILSGRRDDLPHRFRAPAAFLQYMKDLDYGVNQSIYNQIQVGYGAAPVRLLITTRPSQKILELVFEGPDGMRLFTLEIEYGSAEERK
jgi:hypothetical protein